MSTFSNPVFPKIVGPTITTGTSEIEVGGTAYRWKAPVDGTILGVKVIAQRAGVPTVAESDTVVVRLTSQTGTMKTIGPYEILAEPVNAGISTDIMGYREASPTYPINAPCSQGDELKITAAELTPCTVHPYVVVEIKYAANQRVFPQYHAQIVTQTATTTAAGDSTKASMSIVQSNGFTIAQLYGEVVDVTIASGKGISGFFHGYSSQNKAYGDIELAAEGVPAVLAGATGSSIARLSITKDLNIPFQSPATIDWYFKLALAITAAGYWNMMVVYY